MKESNGRLQFLDMAKGLGMIVVILFHIGLSQKVEMFVGAFMLPVFFIISGYCFKLKDDFLTFVKKKSERLLIPYFFFGIILLGAYYVGLGEFLVWAKELLLQRRFTTLWYIAALYFGIIIFWITCKVAKNNVNVIVTISAVLSLIGMLYNNIVAVPLFWNIDTAVAVQIFFALGYACKQKNWESKLVELTGIEKNLLAFTLFVACYALSFVNQLLGFETFQMFFCRYGCIPLTFLSSVCGSLAVLLVASSIQTRFITYVGKSSITFLTLHQTVFMEIMFIIYGSLGINYLKVDGTSTLLYGTITFIFTMICCTFADKMLKKTKMRKYI